MNKGIEYPLNTVLLPIVASRTPGGAGSRPWLVRAVACELGLEPEAIVAAELGFVDAAPSVVYGMDGELLSAPRIDNLEGCHAVLTAFVKAQAADHGQYAVLFVAIPVKPATDSGRCLPPDC